MSCLEPGYEGQRNWTEGRKGGRREGGEREGERE